MDALDGTEWDVLIVGTGIQQSLLALALSRSGKRILHIDKNPYYGGPEAAFSLQEAEQFASRQGDESSGFSSVSVGKNLERIGAGPSSLSFSRAYSLALCPQVIYTRSELLGYLVSSKVHKQLEFLPVGSWWVYSATPTPGGARSHDPDNESAPGPRLFKVPSSREDIFSDQVLDFKAKRSLTKFLRFMVEYEEQPEIWEESRRKPFAEFLVEQFKVPETLHDPLLALTLSPDGPSTTTTEFALARIARHLRSTGVFGPGFNAVIPKWGGISEVSQVACRACAVGGGVYVLGKGVTSLESIGTNESKTSDAHPAARVKVHLDGGQVVTTRWVIGQGQEAPIPPGAGAVVSCSRSIAIVSSPLTPLFPPTSEDGPLPACAVITFPSGSLHPEAASSVDGELPPVTIFVHSSDSGECPAGQCVLYASTAVGGSTGAKLLESAFNALIQSVHITPAPVVLFSLKYEQTPSQEISLPTTLPSGSNVLQFPPAPLDLAFEDAVFERVREMWEKILGIDATDFLIFADRAKEGDEDES